MRLRWLLMLGPLALAAMLLSCGDDKPPAKNPDTGVRDFSALPDNNTIADLPFANQEKQVMPDHGTSDKKVYQDYPPSDYSAGAFGCQADSDCFGQKCCPTPWGVKLCAPTCDIK